MLIPIALVIGGLAMLAGGGELLLRGAVGLAARMRLTPAVIGLTVVAAGTSVPELAVSAIAALEGQTDISTGNVVGSNIFNVLLVLGAAGLVRPIEGAVHAMRFDLGALGVLTVIGAVLLRSERRISRAEGAVLVVAYAVALAVLARSG